MQAEASGRCEEKNKKRGEGDIKKKKRNGDTRKNSKLVERLKADMSLEAERNVIVE